MFHQRLGGTNFTVSSFRKFVMIACQRKGTEQCMYFLKVSENGCVAHFSKIEIEVKFASDSRAYLPVSESCIFTSLLRVNGVFSMI